MLWGLLANFLLLFYNKKFIVIAFLMVHSHYNYVDYNILFQNNTFTLVFVIFYVLNIRDILWNNSLNQFYNFLNTLTKQIKM